MHGGFAANDRALYPAYEVCRARGVPVVVHCGTYSFPGATNGYADPVLLDEVLRDFPTLESCCAHGGRGWWYDAAAFLAAVARDGCGSSCPGLPPSPAAGVLRPARLGPAVPPLDLRHGLAGSPGHRPERPRRGQARPDDSTAALVLGGNATRVYNL